MSAHEFRYGYAPSPDKWQCFIGYYQTEKFFAVATLFYATKL
jgi:hypothetical protein